MAGTGVFEEIIDGEVYKYYADLEWRNSASGKSVGIINPTTRKTQYKVQGEVSVNLFRRQCCLNLTDIPGIC